MPTFLNGLTDEDLKKESKTEAKNDALSGIIKALKCLVSRIPAQEETVKNLEIFRLKVILRSVLQGHPTVSYLPFLPILRNFYQEANSQACRAIIINKINRIKTK